MLNFFLSRPMYHISSLQTLNSKLSCHSVTWLKFSRVHWLESQHLSSAVPVQSTPSWSFTKTSFQKAKQIKILELPLFINTDESNHLSPHVTGTVCNLWEQSLCSCTRFRVSEQSIRGLWQIQDLLFHSSRCMAVWRIVWTNHHSVGIKEKWCKI